MQFERPPWLNGETFWLKVDSESAARSPALPCPAFAFAEEDYKVVVATIVTPDSGKTKRKGATFPTVIFLPLGVRPAARTTRSQSRSAVPPKLALTQEGSQDATAQGGRGWQVASLGQFVEHFKLEAGKYCEICHIAGE